MTIRRRLLAAAAFLATVVLVASVLAGCGVDTDTTPRAINRNQVRDLLSPSSTIPSSPGNGPALLRLYFVRDQQLTEVHRRGRANDARTVIEQLLAGPTQVQRQRLRLTTFIPPGTRLLSVDLSPSGVLVIALSKEMDDISGASARNAYAQLVYTATGAPGVKRVAFQSSDHLIEVPTSGRNKKVVGRADYAESLRNGS